MSTISITTAFVQQFSTNIGMLLQQQGSRLRNAVQEQACFGMAATYMEQFGSVNPAKNLTRNADTPIMGVPQDRRWVYPNDYDWGALIDEEDRLRLLIDPAGPFTMAGMFALGRGMDDEIINGFFSDNMTGQTGATDVGHLAAFNSSSQVVGLTVGSTANCGMNVAKLRKAKQLLLAAEVDLDTEELFVGITSIQHDNLLNEMQAINLDYTNKPVLVEGRIMEFMGFKFIHTERIPGGGSYAGTLSASTEVSGAAYLCPCWAKSGVGLGMWKDATARVAERPDKRFSWQVYATGTYGATRLEEKRCIIIPCV